MARQSLPEPASVDVQSTREVSLDVHHSVHLSNDTIRVLYFARGGELNEEREEAHRFRTRVRETCLILEQDVGREPLSRTGEYRSAKLSGASQIKKRATVAPR